MTPTRRLRMLVMGALVIALALAAVWLFVQTRARTMTAAPSAPPPADAPKVASVARPGGASAPVIASPVVDAPTRVHQTAAEREAAKAQRTKWVRSAIASSPGREYWSDQGQALIEDLGRRAEHVEDSGCFLQGCTGTYTFASRAAYETVYRDITSSDSYAAWTGGKRWSTPEEQDDGRIIVALILYRPN